MLAIETKALNKTFGGITAVDGLDLRVPLRCVYGFLGPNGAGKTTTMRLLLGLLRPDSGTVRLVGYDLSHSRCSALAQVGAFVESPSLYAHLSGRANLDITRRLLRLAPPEIDRVLELVDLRSAADARAGTYSLGMKQRLALARALLGSPRLLLLDEPTNGLDPDGIIAMRHLIRELPDRIGGTVFVSSHLLAEVEQIADHAGLMRRGRLLVQDKVKLLLRSGAVISITTDRSTEAALLLSDRGMDVSGEEHCVILQCDQEVSEHQAAAANRILVEAGFAVSSLVPKTRTLEDVYRSALDDDALAEQEAA